MSKIDIDKKIIGNTEIVSVISIKEKAEEKKPTTKKLKKKNDDNKSI